MDTAGGISSCPLPFPIQCFSLVPLCYIPTFVHCSYIPVFSDLFGSRASSRLLTLVCHDLSIEEIGSSHFVLKTQISSVCDFFHRLSLMEAIILNSNLQGLGLSIRVPSLR